MSEMKKEKEELLRKFIDGELTDEEEAKALHRIADDPEMRDILRFERTLFKSLPGYQPAAEVVPENFADVVMHKIEEKKSFETADKKDSIEKTPVFERFKKILEEALAPRQVSFRPVWMLAVLLIIYVAISLPDTQDMDPTLLTQADQQESLQMVSQQEEKVWVRFVYIDDEAENVSVAGDFSDWEPVELNPEFAGDQQVWTGMVQLSRGEQRYMFIKNDEQWVTDPFAEIQRDDGFGNKNAVIYL